MVQWDMKLELSTHEALQFLNISLMGKIKFRDLFKKTNFNDGNFLRAYLVSIEIVLIRH